MALYRMEVKILGRSKGHSVVAAAAYRAGERLRDERTGISHDYRPKAARVAYGDILAPEGAPAWVQEREKLWNAVEAKENRKDAQLARELLLSLPRELDLSGQIALVRDFLQREYVSKGMIADLAVHVEKAGDDGDNPHAHVLLTMRRLTGDGFGAKARDWNPQFTGGQWVKDKDRIIEARSVWAEYVNRALSDAGARARVDHRSLTDRGIVREAEPKLGKAKHLAKNRPDCAAKAEQVQEIRFLNGQRRSRAASRYQDPWVSVQCGQKSTFRACSAV